MKTLYLECGMGAAGDMLMAALLELHGDAQGFLDRLNRAGIRGTHVTVSINGEVEAEETAHHHTHHTHTGMHEIEHLIGDLAVSDGVKRGALAVYRLIAEAESSAHGIPVSQIHFHEVGSMDAVADIVGVCLLLEELAPDRILASPVHVGSGHVRCAHGILPVPAPATALILRGVPIYGGDIVGELCTPTGAALLKHFAAGFEALPTMTIEKIGCGMGSRDFACANCVRAFWGEGAAPREEVTELTCNLDDMTPEAVAFAQQLLLDEGALDVYTLPIGMKKGRPGVLLSCLCASGDRDRFVSLIFRHTTTLGLRETVSRRYTLDRQQHTVPSPYGPIRVKTASGYGVTRSKPEYEDLAKIARQNDIPLHEAAKAVGEEQAASHRTTTRSISEP